MRIAIENHSISVNRALQGLIDGEGILGPGSSARKVLRSSASVHRFDPETDKLAARETRQFAAVMTSAGLAVDSSPVIQQGQLSIAAVGGVTIENVA